MRPDDEQSRQIVDRLKFFRIHRPIPVTAHLVGLVHRTLDRVNVDPPLPHPPGRRRTSRKRTATNAAVAAAAAAAAASATLPPPLPATTATSADSICRCPTVIRTSSIPIADWVSRALRGIVASAINFLAGLRLGCKQRRSGRFPRFLGQGLCLATTVRSCCPGCPGCRCCCSCCCCCFSLRAGASRSCRCCYRRRCGFGCGRAHFRPARARLLGVLGCLGCPLPRLLLFLVLGWRRRLLPAYGAPPLAASGTSFLDDSFGVTFLVAAERNRRTAAATAGCRLVGRLSRPGRRRRWRRGSAMSLGGTPW